MSGAVQAALELEPEVSLLEAEAEVLLGAAGLVVVVSEEVSELLEVEVLLVDPELDDWRASFL